MPAPLLSVTNTDTVTLGTCWAAAALTHIAKTIAAMRAADMQEMVTHWELRFKLIEVMA
jgi:hypothetical protein